MKILEKKKIYIYIDKLIKKQKGRKIKLPTESKGQW